MIKTLEDQILEPERPVNGSIIVGYPVPDINYHNIPHTLDELREDIRKEKEELAGMISPEYRNPVLFGSLYSPQDNAFEDEVNKFLNTIKPGTEISDRVNRILKLEAKADTFHIAESAMASKDRSEFLTSGEFTQEDLYRFIVQNKGKLPPGCKHLLENVPDDDISKHLYGSE